MDDRLTQTVRNAMNDNPEMDAASRPLIVFYMKSPTCLCQMGSAFAEW